MLNIIIIQAKGLSKDIIKEIKARRRTMKNRDYAKQERVAYLDLRCNVGTVNRLFLSWYIQIFKMFGTFLIFALKNYVSNYSQFSTYIKMKKT